MCKMNAEYKYDHMFTQLLFHYAVYTRSKITEIVFACEMFSFVVSMAGIQSDTFAMKCYS